MFSRFVSICDSPSHDRAPISTMEQQGHSEPGPVLRLTGPDLCPTCARVSLDLSEVDPVQDDESESYNMVNIYAILRGADGTASEKWRPTVSACRAGSAAGCPLCRFALAALERVSVGPGADVGDWLVDMSLCPVDPFYYKSSHELDIPAQPFGFRHSGPYAVGFNFANPNTGLPVYVKVSGYTEKGQSLTQLGEVLLTGRRTGGIAPYTVRSDTL